MSPKKSRGAETFAVTLAADIRFNQPDFTNDQIWELRLQGGEPSALALQTTYGLRAHWMRIFPRMIRKDKTYCDPALFHIPPQLERLFPNYVRVFCAPFDGLELRLEYWIPSSQGLTCRVQVKNNSILKEPFRMEWAALLSPLEGGVAMAPFKKDRACFLTGQTSSLAPVFLMDDCSDARSGPYPALSLDLDPYPGNSITLKWACAALDQREDSFQLAQQMLYERWEARAAQIELVNASQMLAIHTGHEEWDQALALSQTTAYSLVLPGRASFPAPGFVLSRQPDHGYSLRGDGSDTTHLWKGQTALDAFYLASLLLPGRAGWVKGWVENFLSIQDDQGRIDWRSAPPGQANRRQAQPLLAQLAWQTAQYLPDGPDWLAEIYARLLRFFNAWFEPGMDRDGDGFPEWEHPIQTGAEDLPLFDLWHATGQGVDISTLEAPALAALLAGEAEALMRIARLCGLNADLEQLTQRKTRLKEALQPAWDAREGLFLYQDFQLHRILRGGSIKTVRGSGKFSLHKAFKTPQRFQCKFVSEDGNTRAVTLRLKGTGPEGEWIEEIPPRRWTWTSNQGRATCQHLFTALAEIEVLGAAPKDVISIERVDTQQKDITLFLPLWAGLCSPAQAKKMVEKAWKGTFDQPFGPPLYAGERVEGSRIDLNGVSPLWASFLGEGLLAYGYRKEAVELFTRLMEAITSSLKRYTSFKECYDAGTGQPIGEKNHIHGLAPLGFFLKLIGIQKITQREVILTDFNPFPWPVTVQYLGTNVEARFSETVVTFSSGESVRVSDPGPHRVCLD